MHIRWRLLAAIWDCADSIRNTHTARLVINSGLPVSEHTALATPITGRLDGQLWRDAISYDEAAGLARLLSTACFILVAYLSGARVGEKRAELHLIRHSTRSNISEAAAQGAARRQLAA